MAALVSIELDSNLPLYAQIVEGLKRAYAHGRLRKGDMLPPFRRLAEDIGVDPNTVVRAYRDLAAAGFLELRRGRGTKVVCSQSRPEVMRRTKTFEMLLERLAVEGELLDLSPEDILFAVESHLKLSKKRKG